MDNKEKLYELLNKDELNPSELAELNSLLKDYELNQYYTAYNAVKKAVKSGSHVSYQQLYNYILLKNGNEPEDKNILAQLPQIEEHLRKCDKCKEEFTSLNQEYTDIENFINTPVEAFDDKSSVIPASLTPVWNVRGIRFAFTSMVTLGVLYFIMFFISEISTPDSHKLASINENEFYVTRGRATDNFQRSLAAIENKDYSDAIKYLQADIKDNNEDESIFYSHYILGLTYLETADKDFLGLFLYYDEEAAANGLRNLKDAVALNRSGKFPNVTYDAYFFLAKANLMLGYNDAAKQYLQQVIYNKGSKINEAQKMLSELE